MKKNLPKVSFFIMSFNDAKNMELAILSVKKQKYPKDKIEIIVIDDGSTDNSLEIAKKYKTGAILAVGMKVPRWPECHIPEWAKNLKTETKKTLNKRLFALYKTYVVSPPKPDQHNERRCADSA